MKEKCGTGKIIMSRKPWVSFYSQGIWHPIPYAGPDEVMAAAKKLNVEFLVIDERFIPQTRPQLAHLLDENVTLPGWQRIYVRNSPKRIFIYQRLVP